MKKDYDYLIVGSGLYGVTFAHLAHKHGKKCLVIDKQAHLGGNIFCESIEGINVHKYGAHMTYIEAHTKYLKDLFDQMLKTTFEMIREHNQAMDRRFLNLPGETELKRQSKIDIDIFGDFINHDSLKLSDLASKYDVNVKIIEEVIKDISKRGVLVLEIDGEYAKVVKRAATNGQATETEINGSNDDCGSNF